MPLIAGPGYWVGSPARAVHSAGMTATDPKTAPESTGKAVPSAAEKARADTRPDPDTVPEIGGRKGPDPTRYGDWEKDGRCIDF